MDRASRIRLALFDVDGVLTDGRVYFGPEGEVLKVFSAHDGHGLRMLKFHGFTLGIISGRQSESVARRMADIGVEHIFQGHRDKRQVYEQLLAELGLSPAETAYVGDDVVDLQVMHHVGLAIAVKDAHPLVKQYSHWVTTLAGGYGAAREVCELILQSQGLLDKALNYYLQ